MNNLFYYLALNRMSQVGPRTVMKLQQHWPDLEEMFKLPSRQLELAGLPSWLAQTISNFSFREIDADIEWSHASPTHHLFSWDSPHYPNLLKEIPDPPIILYAKGHLSALKKNQIAMVGSRNPSIIGTENARRFARELAKHGLTIVSGLALGIDAQAHLGCLDVQGQTIAVLGTGIDCIYPRRHASLAQKITENGLICSEFPLKSPPIAGHFPRRNRIISGLSLCTLVVEAAIHSGSLITARMAVEQNRDVLAIPGSIHNPLSRGCNHLLQQGAKLVASVQDVLNELGLYFEQTDQEKEQKKEDNSMLPLASRNKNLVEFIGFEITSIDQIIARSGYTVEQTTAKLAELELLGAIYSVPGGYIRC